SDAPLPESVSASDGIVSTVRDLARLDAAIDDGILLRPETLTAAWTNASGRDGAALPTGLGWFVQSYHGEPVVWQFGLIPGAYSRAGDQAPAAPGAAHQAPQRRRAHPASPGQPALERRRDAIDFRQHLPATVRAMTRAAVGALRLAALTAALLAGV